MGVLLLGRSRKRAVPQPWRAGASMSELSRWVCGAAEEQRAALGLLCWRQTRVIWDRLEQDHSSDPFPPHRAMLPSCLHS